MTGGSVIETNGDYDHIEIVVEDQGERLAIKVEVSAEAQSISEGDSVWWQGRKAYWSPKNRKRGYFDNAQDFELRRIGYSYKPTGGRILNLLKELSTLIEWQGPEPYITKRGKVKAVCKGIPSKGFWLLWKHEKEQIKALGVTLSFSWAASVRTTKDGLPSRSGGRYDQTPKKRKEWEATLWIGPKNTALLSRLGFTPPPVEEERDMERVCDSIDSELVEQPF